MSLSVEVAQRFAAKSGQNPSDILTDIAKVGAVRGIENRNDEPDYGYLEGALEAACVAYHIPDWEMTVDNDGTVSNNSDWGSLTEEEQDEVQDKIDETYDALYQSVMDEADAVYDDMTQLILNY